MRQCAKYVISDVNNRMSTLKHMAVFKSLKYLSISSSVHSKEVENPRGNSKCNLLLCGKGLPGVP